MFNKKIYEKIEHLSNELNAYRAEYNEIYEIVLRLREEYLEKDSEQNELKEKLEDLEDRVEALEEKDSNFQNGIDELMDFMPKSLTNLRKNGLEMHF